MIEQGIDRQIHQPHDQRPGQLIRQPDSSRKRPGPRNLDAVDVFGTYHVVGHCR